MSTPPIRTEAAVSPQEAEPQDVTITIAFVASCLNEAGNVAELYRRCLAVFGAYVGRSAHPQRYRFGMTLADNGSDDGTAEALAELAAADGRVQILINARNYGPEPSVVNALAATEAEITVLLASDLQDPPELVGEMLALLERPGSNRDAVLACKRSLPKSPLLNAARWLYYRLLAYGTRSQRAPNGFHGFGAYRREVVEDGVELWRQTTLSLRQALTSASHSRELLPYDLQGRRSGRSSYNLLGYGKEALANVFSGEAITTRLTMGLGLATLLLAILVGSAVIFNVIRGSGYAAGTPTLMLLVLASMALQTLMLSLLAYQIENLNLPIKRPVVRVKRKSEKVAANQENRIRDHTSF